MSAVAAISVAFLDCPVIFTFVAIAALLKHELKLLGVALIVISPSAFLQSEKQLSNVITPAGIVDNFDKEISPENAPSIAYIPTHYHNLVE